MAERIDALKRERDLNPHDEQIEARYQALVDRWHTERRYISDSFLYMLRVAMTLEPLHVWELLDSCREPNAIEREMIVDMTRLRRDVQDIARAVANLERKAG